MNLCLKIDKKNDKLDIFWLIEFFKINRQIKID